MSSQRRIDSSRANGAKSHGPVTDEGKARACANNIRHGLLAATLVLDEEDHAAFAELISTIEEELQPATPIEKTIVENMAACQWRRMRLLGIERGNIADEVDRQPAAPPSRRVGRAYRQLCEQSNVTQAMNRYDARLAREYYRCREILLNSRKLREKAEE